MKAIISRATAIVGTGLPPSASTTSPFDMDNCWRAVPNNHIFQPKAQAREVKNTKGSSLKIITEPVEIPTKYSSHE